MSQKKLDYLERFCCENYEPDDVGLKYDDTMGGMSFEEAFKLGYRAAQANILDTILDILHESDDLF